MGADPYKSFAMGADDSEEESAPDSERLEMQGKGDAAFARVAEILKVPEDDREAFISALYDAIDACRGDEHEK